MTVPSATLPELLARFVPLFPASAPLELIPSAQAFGPHEARFSGGHAARWFAATDGQSGVRPFADRHRLCSLREALAGMETADELRAKPDGYWVEPHWLAIASDGTGQHFMVDDRDGRVLAVRHDHDGVDEIAPSAEAWLEQLLTGHAEGTMVWSQRFGLVDASRLARAPRTSAKRELPLSKKDRLVLAGVIGVMLLISALMVWFFESRR